MYDIVHASELIRELFQDILFVQMHVFRKPCLGRELSGRDVKPVDTAGGGRQMRR